MLELITYRGPDDEGQEWVETARGWVGLGNRRLAVVDTSAAGHQPMARDGCLLAYNGEVYNFVELRRELERSGDQFLSGTDTEVVLALLNRYGTAGLERLNGMFALAWWNAAERELVLARDRFGIKPLVYTETRGELWFASESKCLFPTTRPEFELRALPSYLAFGWVPGELTLMRGILELSPGHLLRWSDGSVEIESFREARPAEVGPIDADQASSELEKRLSDAVARQMVADVPVGVLLSGGLDSTAIAAYASRTSGRTVNAYTIAFRSSDARFEQSADDLRFSRLAARRLGLDLREFEISPDVVGLLERVAWHLDDPIADPAAILTLLISEAAAKEVTVLLSGQGSDELFGGYRVHLYSQLAPSLARMPRRVRNALSAVVDEFPAMARRLPSGAKPGFWLAACRAARMMLDNVDLTPEDRYIAFRSAYYFPDGGRDSLLTAGVASELAIEDPGRVHRAVFSSDDGPFFDRMLAVDLATFLVNQNLAYSDRLSMAASIEMRVPFLDDAVADLALGLPEQAKVRRLRGKAVLREALEGVVPKEIIRRRKAGFGAPIRGWLQGELAGFVRDVVSTEWVEGTGLFRANEVSRLIDEHIAGEADHTYRIWTLLSLALWWRVHLNGSRT
jgi:asparagine synthase (glutamine-hydrolysing)